LRRSSRRRRHALAEAQQAIDLDSSYAEAYAYQAEAYTDVGRPDLALPVVQQAISLNPRSLDAQRDLGYVLEMQGKYTDAIAQYRGHYWRWGWRSSDDGGPYWPGTRIRRSPRS